MLGADALASLDGAFAMIDIPAVRYVLIAALILLVLFAWWSIRSQFVSDDAGLSAWRWFRGDGSRARGKPDRS